VYQLYVSAAVEVAHITLVVTILTAQRLLLRILEISLDQTCVLQMEAVEAEVLLLVVLAGRVVLSLLELEVLEVLVGVQMVPLAVVWGVEVGQVGTLVLGVPEVMVMEQQLTVETELRELVEVEVEEVELDRI
jgi:hypothetical protein